MQLRIQTTYPHQNIEYEMPVVEIHQQSPKVQVETSGPAIVIDQKESLAQLGRVAPFEYNRQRKQINYQKTQASIAEIAQRGDRIARSLATGQIKTIVPQMVKEKYHAQKREIEVDTLPKTPPKIQFHYDSTIDFSEGQVLIDLVPQAPQSTWTLGAVHIDVMA